MKIRQAKSFPHIRYLILCYLLGLVFFTLFRLCTFCLDAFHPFTNEPNAIALILQTFEMGFRFDTVISCYVLSFPFVLLCLGQIFSIYNKWFYLSIHIFVAIIYVLCCAIQISDIPYFRYFFSRLTISALSFTENLDFIFKMLLQESSYRIYILLFFIVVFIFVWILNRIYKSTLKRIPSSPKEPQSRRKIVLNIVVFFVFSGVIFIGMRGRIAIKSPIRIGTAYFSSNAYANQMGLNPCFTFVKSLLDYKDLKRERVQLMDEDLALNFASQELRAEDSLKHLSPIARHHHFENPTHYNVVVVIMESMSAVKTGFLGNTPWTPALDSIAGKGLSFSNIYTAGIHTHNGIYSTLFAHPALMQQHGLKRTQIPKMNGLSACLSEKGYETLYFTTHDDQFDNVGGFLRANNFQNIISQKDYRSEEVKSTLGVPDHIMFDKAIDVFNQHHTQIQKPFFAALMTASDHGPYILPENIDFMPSSKNIRTQIIEYADWAIGQFLEKVKKQPWFDQTIFVFVADHGCVWSENRYSMPLSYHHTPLIFYSPSLIMPEVSEKKGLQIDVFPTVMGLLRESYTNTTFGVDLVHEDERPFVYFSANDKLGVLNDQFFYIWKTDGSESLFRYKEHGTKNLKDMYPQLVDSMKTYGFSMIQAAQTVLNQTPRL